MKYRALDLIIYGLLVVMSLECVFLSVLYILDDLYIFSLIYLTVSFLSQSLAFKYLSAIKQEHSPLENDRVLFIHKDRPYLGTIVHVYELGLSAEVEYIDSESRTHVVTMPLRELTHFK